MNRVEPRIIVSPISGQPSVPRIIETRVGQNIVKEAHWYDPASGAFIRKGTIDITPINRKENKP
jgi:hypothetical protein